MKAGSNRRQWLIPFPTHCSRTDGYIRAGGSGWLALCILKPGDCHVCTVHIDKSAHHLWETNLCGVTPASDGRSYQALFWTEASHAPLLISGRPLEKYPSGDSWDRHCRFSLQKKEKEDRQNHEEFGTIFLMDGHRIFFFLSSMSLETLLNHEVIIPTADTMK